MHKPTRASLLLLLLGTSCTNTTGEEPNNPADGGASSGGVASSSSAARSSSIPAGSSSSAVATSSVSTGSSTSRGSTSSAASSGSSSTAGVTSTSSTATSSAGSSSVGSASSVGGVTSTGSSGTSNGSSLAASSSGQPGQDVDFMGRPLPDFLPVGTYAGITACELVGGTPAPGLGGYAPCGSYLMPVGRCNDGMLNTVSTFNNIYTPITNTVQNVYMLVMEDLKTGNTYLGGNDIRWGQRQNDAFIMKFRTGGQGEYPPNASLPVGAYGSLFFVLVEHPNRGTSAVRFASVSTSPCDFDYARLDANDPCYKRLGIAGGGTISTHIVPDGVAPGTGACGLRPNTTYYLNTRWEDPEGAARGLISCKTTPDAPLGTHCGTNMAIQ